MKTIFRLFIIVMCFFMLITTYVNSALFEDNKVTMEKVIIYLQILAGMDITQSADDLEKETNTIGTGSISGVYFPTGGALSQIFNNTDKLDSNQFTVESTPGSVFNIDAVVNGDLDFAIAQSDKQYQAVKGIADWEDDGPQYELRAMFSIYPESVNIIASDDSGIDSVSDLIGKKVYIGPELSGHRQNSIDILDAFQIDYQNDLLIVENDTSEPSELLARNEIDAFFYTVGHPSQALLSAIHTNRVHFVPIEGDLIDNLVANKSYYSKTSIPLWHYSGVSNDSEIQTIAVKATLVTSARQSKNKIYEMTKAIFENLETFPYMHPAYEGMYYPTGGAIAQLVNKTTDTHNIRLSIVSTPGSVYNIENLMNHRIEFGLVQSDTQYQAYYGFGEWNAVGPQESLRSVFSIYDESVTLIASEESAIQSVADLSGKKVNLGNEGSGQLQNSIDILTAFGIDIGQDLTPSYHHVSDAPRLLQEGNIDAFFLTAAHTNLVVTEALSGEKNVNIIPITGDEVLGLISGYPYYAKTVIPQNTYAELNKDIETIAVKATLMTTSDIPDDIVYYVCKQMFENLDTFKTMHLRINNSRKHAGGTFCAGASRCTSILPGN
jgi:TRAP transporter TAXI family solute receptor